MSAPPHAIVTGSASGIGHAVARRLLADGWRVTGIDLAPQQPGERFAPVACDLLDTRRVEDLAEGLAQQRPTALVHAAGIMRSDADPATRTGGGETLWRLHVVAAEALIRGLAPAMPDGAGRIVLVSSRASQGRAGRAFYAASKAGVEAVARCHAANLVSRGVTINAIAPGATDTPQLRDPVRADAPIRLPPIGRLIRPEEVAGLVSFLVGPDAGAITGQTLVICGGASLAAAIA